MTSIAEPTFPNNFFFKEFDRLGYGLLWLDKEQRVQGHNPAYRALLNVDFGDQGFVGRPFQELLDHLTQCGEFASEDPGHYLTGHLESLRTNQPFEAQRVRADGSALSVSVTPLVSGGHVYLYQDVSEERRLRESLRHQSKASILTIANLAEHRDPNTGIHVLRVSRLVGQTARKLLSQGKFTETIDEAFIERVATASILHDVGKISTPDYILFKAGPLTPEERAIIQQHTITGEKLLKHARLTMSDNHYLDLSSEIALTHHECFDGSGYPYGLKGTDIPLSGRICAVADVFDALTSNRPYKAAWHVDDALKLLKEQRGRQFDPGVVDAFIEVITERENACLIRWTPELSVGDINIDDQHRMLIDIINQLANKDTSHNQHAIAMVIDELLSYAAFHFNYEEKRMAAAEYPGLEKHKRYHARFVQRVNEFREEMVIKQRGLLSEAVLDYLKNWFSGHIMEEDQAYAPFLKGPDAW